MEPIAAVPKREPSRNSGKTKHLGLVVDVVYHADGNKTQNGPCRLRAESIKSLVAQGIMSPTDGVTRVDSGFTGSEMFYTFIVDRIHRQFRAEAPTRLGEVRGICREVPCRLL